MKADLVRTDLVGLFVLVTAATVGLSLGKTSTAESQRLASPAIASTISAASTTAGPAATPRLSAALPSVTIVKPVFGQLVVMSQPSEYKVVDEGINGDRYFRAAVRADQSLEDWTEMVSLVGGKGLAANPDATPIAVAQAIAHGFNAACPATFTAKPLGGTKYGAFDAFLALAGCGTIAGETGPRSEASLIVTIKGKDDFYSIQWLERGPASDKAPDLDDPKWLERYKRVGPIRLCPMLDGEAAPYASCLNAK